MLFNSWEFLIFFPIVVLIDFVLPGKIRYLWLLAASYYFYMCWNPKYILLIAFSTVITYASGLLLDRIHRDGGASSARRKRWVVAGSFIVNLGLLGFFKYHDFFLGNLNHLLQLLHVRPVESGFRAELPVGISFYTFQALSYTMDVYRGGIPAERNLGRYALFVSFFPQLVAGPIERSKNLLREIQALPNKKLWDYERVTRGLMLMLYGMFLKLVIADRVSGVVDVIFSKCRDFGGPVLWAGAAGFALQIYCDFASYSTIAIGAAKVLDFKLMDNFSTPYFSQSIREFWRRWHISLSTWFRDYLYIPLGGSRCSAARRRLNLMIVFLVSGLWHGAGWHFVAWGCLHGIYQIVGELTLGFRDGLWKRLGAGDHSRIRACVRIAVTFVLVCVAWVFFRADTLPDACRYLKGMLAITSGKGIRELIGALSKREWLVLAAAILGLFGAGLIQYRRGDALDDYLAARPLLLRWAVLYALLFGTLIFGVYGPEYSQQAFIYFQF